MDQRSWRIVLCLLRYRFFCVLFLTPTVAANNHGVTFLYPVIGLTFNYLATVNLSWLSPSSAPLLYTFWLNDTGTGGLLTSAFALYRLLYGSAVA